MFASQLILLFTLCTVAYNAAVRIYLLSRSSPFTVGLNLVLAEI